MMDGPSINHRDPLNADPLSDTSSDDSSSSNDDDESVMLILMATHLYLTARDSFQPIELS